MYANALLRKHLLSVQENTAEWHISHKWKVVRGTIRCQCQMFGPGESLDLNSIVNTWSHIKLKWTGIHCPATHELFEAIRIEWNNTDSSSVLTLLSVKSCLQVGKGYSVLSYFIYSICAILANFLTSDLWLKQLKEYQFHERVYMSATMWWYVSK